MEHATKTNIHAHRLCNAIHSQEEQSQQSHPLPGWLWVVLMQMLLRLLFDADVEVVQVEVEKAHDGPGP